MRHGSGAVGKDIFDVSGIQKTADRTGKLRAVVLLVCLLAFAVESYDVVRVALEESAVFGLAVAAVACILDYVGAFMEENERVGIGMGVIPCHAGFDSEHGGVLIP